MLVSSARQRGHKPLVLKPYLDNIAHLKRIWGCPLLLLFFMCGVTLVLLCLPLPYFLLYGRRPVSQHHFAVFSVLWTPCGPSFVETGVLQRPLGCSPGERWPIARHDAACARITRHDAAWVFLNLSGGDLGLYFHVPSARFGTGLFAFVLLLHKCVISVGCFGFYFACILRRLRLTDVAIAPRNWVFLPVCTPTRLATPQFNQVPPGRLGPNRRKNVR